MRFPKMSSTTKKLATGGVLAGAIVGLESGMSWFVAGYPEFLKGQILPPLPRNGALLADLGPAGAAVYLKKKKPKYDNLANGMLFYDLPKLLDQVVYNIAYNAGRPAGGMRTAAPLRLNIRQNATRPTMTNGVAAQAFAYPQTGVTGKYAMKAANNRVVAAGGIGRYR